jgi:copper chaperone CopZ
MGCKKKCCSGKASGNGTSNKIDNGQTDDINSNDNRASGVVDVSLLIPTATTVVGTTATATDDEALSSEKATSVVTKKKKSGCKKGCCGGGSSNGGKNNENTKSGEEASSCTSSPGAANATKPEAKTGCCSKGSCSKKKKSSIQTQIENAKDNSIWKLMIDEDKKVNDDDDAATATTCCSDPSSCTKDCCSTNVCLAPRSPGPIFNTTASRVLKPVVVSSTTVARSTFTAKAICCASEVPAVESLLSNLVGVTHVMVNVPLRQVLVDHDPSIVTAVQMERILNDNSFDATTDRDGGDRDVNGGGATTGRSKFFVEKICCASEIPAVRSIVEPLEGVFGVFVNSTTKEVLVDHDTSMVTAQGICDALNDVRFEQIVGKSILQLALTVFFFISLLSNFRIGGIWSEYQVRLC